MTHKAYVATDLGPGDGGKGGVVHRIATMTPTHTILKDGGAQGSHGVVTASGEHFAFSHWGCGTFEGVTTHITPRMIIAPEGLLNEGDALVNECRISEAFDLLTVDELALCSVHYHGIASRLKELARGQNPRGTTGTGIGEALRDSLRFPELAIRARDLSRPNIRDLIAAVREQVTESLAPILQSEFLPEDQEEAQSEIALLHDDGFLDFIVERFQEAAGLVRIVDSEFLRREILPREGIVVVERSHGILTDQQFGFHPHTSAIRTLPCFAQAMLLDAGFDGQIVNIGVHRAYQIRHGAGPMPTHDPRLIDSLLPGSHKESNRYKGEVRVGPLDLVLLRYAIEVCGGPAAFDGLAITWFDQIQKNQEWCVCHRYEKPSPDFFSPWGGIQVRRWCGEEQLEYQEALGKQLLQCVPEITTHKVPTETKQESMYALCASVLQEHLEVPVRMVSFGPTEDDKICK